MLIVCDSCGAEYEVELDPGEGLEGSEAVRFRCSACGHTFSIGGDRASTSGLRDDWSEDPGVAEPAAEDPPMLLKQEGKVYQVDDVATLQRWIAERRVLREDLLSIGGLKWEPVGTRRDLQVFFQLVDTVEKNQGEEGAASPPVEGMAAQDHGAVQGAAPWEVGVGQGPPANANSSWVDSFAAPAADDDEWEDDEGTDAGLPVIGAPPVADDADPTDLPDREDLPNLAGIDAPEPTLEVPRQTPEAVPLPAADEQEPPSASEPVPMLEEPSASSSGPSVRPAAETSASSAPLPLGEAEPTETMLSEDRATEEVGRSSGDLSEDMLFPDERESEGLPPVPMASGMPAGGGDTGPYGSEPEPRRAGVPPWAVAAIILLLLGGAWWFMGRGGTEEPGATSEPELARDDDASAPGAPEGPSTEAASGEAPPADAADGEAPAEAAAAGAATTVAAADGSRPGSGALMPAPAPPVGRPASGAGAAGGPAAGDAAARETAAREAAARDAAARDAAARETAARDAAARETAARDAAAREAAAREAAARQAAAQAPAPAPAPRATSVKALVDQGWALVEGGDLTTARARFSEALTRSPGSSDARFGLGYAYEKLGNEAAAVRNYCQVARDGSGDAKIEAQGRLRALDASCE